MPGRRRLAFAALDDVMPDVDRLLLGHEMVGEWTLGQVCRHLSKAVRYTVRGRPIRVPWVRRVLLGRLAKWYVFRRGGMPEGVKVPSPRLIPPPGLDDRVEAESLREAIRELLAEPGPPSPHPVFGPMTSTEWRRFHCIHCAHHLSFALPRRATSLTA